MAASTIMLALLGLCSVLQIQGTALRETSDPVRLDVHYESLCSDSMSFVVNQLAVVYPQLKDILHVEIFPYGKASERPTVFGGYTFTCQHGPNECLGNKMLACAKKLITDNDLYVQFNICVMSSLSPPHAGQKCADELALSYAEIDTCATSIEGEQELHKVGLVTNGLVPTLHYVPWMVVDDEHTDNIQSEAEFNLLQFTCSQYTGLSKPIACENV